MKFKYRQKEFDIEGASQEDHIYKCIVNNRSFYEIELLEYMLEISKFFHRNNSIAIDVGANIGNHSIYFESFLTDYIIAVEPNADILPILERNLKQNAKNYTIYENAFGEIEGEGIIVLPGNSKNNIGMAKIESNPKGDSNNKTVKIITLDSMIDDWLQNHDIDGSISILKIDVEGMELAVLKGAGNTIKKHRPHIFLEAATIEEFNKLNNYLGSLGYIPLSCWAATPVYHFVFKPTKSLISTVRRIKFQRAVKKVIVKIIRKLKRLLSR